MPTALIADLESYARYLVLTCKAKLRTFIIILNDHELFAMMHLFFRILTIRQTSI